MRRLAALTIALVAVAAAGVTWAGSRAQGGGTARFDVIFDDARGLVGGQLVKIAGARAGTIDNVVVTSDFKARIEASVDSRFMPFHQDATCTIRPEGLIAENYIDCDPGTADSPPLRGSPGHPPTVAVAHTTEPVSLLDLFNTFNLPTRERFMIVIDELGIGTAARGADLNAILRRANPTLALARQVISILERQRRQLATIVDASHTVLAQAASHPEAVQRFLDHASGLTSLIAQHRDPLSSTISRLPALLGAAQPALRQLDTVAVDGTPLLAQLRAATPYLDRVSVDLGPFVNAARPALATLTTTLRQAIPALRVATPLVTTLRSYAERSLASTLLFARLAANLQQHGFVENFFSVPYYIGAALSRFDTNSHLLSLLLVGAQNGKCGTYATHPVAGCSAHWGQYPPYQRSAADQAGSGSATPVGASPAAGSPAAASAGAGALAAVSGAAASAVGGATSAVGGATSALGAAASATGQAGSGAPRRRTAPMPPALQNLVNYLLR